ncbi:MAG: hypothetical protein WBN40_04070 [Pseudomonadales bacterium]
MNIQTLLIKVGPPVLVCTAFFASNIVYSQADNGAPHSDPGSVPASEATKIFKRYDLGSGRTLVVNSAKAFEAYDNWIIDPASFELDKRERALSMRGKKRLQAMLVDARVEQTKSYGGTVVKAVSPCTLKQQLRLENLRLSRSENRGSQLNFVRSFGDATIVAEIKDAETDEPVFIYSEKISLGGGVVGSGAPNITRLAKAIKIVMNNAHKMLVHALPLRETSIAARQQFGCAGQLGKHAVQLRADREAMAER